MKYFDEKRFKTSEYPHDFIPKGAKTWVGIDYAEDGKDFTVKGFYDPNTGEYHIQEIDDGLLKKG